MDYLLDTNIISELRKRTPDPGVAAWMDGVPDQSTHLSVLVIGEIRQGIERRRPKDPAQAVILEKWLSGLEEGYADRIIPVTAAEAHEWGRMNARTPIATPDGLMAATAKLRGWTFVTRNVGDVENCGVRLLNPFTQAGP